MVVIALTFSTNMNATTPAVTHGGSIIVNFFKSLFGSGGHKGKDKPSKPGGGDAVPLDGGLGILLVGAAAFGVKKLRENKNEQA